MVEEWCTRVFPHGVCLIRSQWMNLERLFFSRRALWRWHYQAETMCQWTTGKVGIASRRNNHTKTQTYQGREEDYLNSCRKRSQTVLRAELGASSHLRTDGTFSWISSSPSRPGCSGCLWGVERALGTFHHPWSFSWTHRELEWLEPKVRTSFPIARSLANLSFFLPEHQ